MERFSGALMVLAGVALGGYAFLPTSETVPDAAHVAAVPSPTAQSDGRTASGVRVFSPSTPLVTPAPGATSATTTTWTAVVTSERSSANQLKSARPGDAEARWHLASDLQRELKRVGCYGGEINGAWTQSTRRAMSVFMDRVNATLPFDEPDYILLTLVQNHASLACGECPAGQVVSDTGQCLPNAVVAQVNKRAQERQAERRLAEQRKAEQQERLAAEQRATEQRRVVIAQRAEAQRLEAQRIERQRVAEKTAKTARVAAASETLPWLGDGSQTSAQAQNVAAAQPAARAAPLPGMMSVGGPRAGAPADVPSGAAVAATGHAAMPAVAPDRFDRDDLDDLGGASASEIVPPAPRPAVRPQYASRDAGADAGLPGTKAGPDARAVDLVAPAAQADVRKYSRAKVVRRTPPYYDGPRAKKYSAYGYTGKTRRGQPRPGSPRYNLLLSLGGLY